MQFRTFEALFGFLLVLETVQGFLDAHAGVHFKEVLEIIGYSAAVGEPLFFGYTSSERR